MKPIRVLLVENHHLVRRGIRSVLENFSDLEVVGEADNGEEGLTLMQELKPDVVLMDIALPGMTGIEATAHATQLLPGVRVLMLSIHTGVEYVLRALSAGAAGYLVKNARPPELELAIKAAADGEMYLSPTVSRPVLSDYLERIKQDTGRPRGPLTPRQLEVLRLVATGHSTKDIANILGRSTKTVEMHRMQLMKRLNVHDIAALVRYAIREGLITSKE